MSHGLVGYFSAQSDVGFRSYTIKEVLPMKGR